MDPITTGFIVGGATGAAEEITKRALDKGKRSRRNRHADPVCGKARVHGTDLDVEVCLRGKQVRLEGELIGGLSFTRTIRVLFRKRQVSREARQTARYLESSLRSRNIVDADK
jgi:hypothetical protein